MKFLTSELSTPIKLVIGLLLALVISVAISIALAINYLNSPLAVPSAGFVFEISEGSSLSSVSRQLKTKGIVEYPQLFTALARYRGVANAIQVGEYEISRSMSAADLLEKLISGDTLQYRITLVEGWTFAEALLEIQAGTKVKVTLQEFSSEELAAQLGVVGESVEGVLFPDTYFYTAGTTDLDIVVRAKQKMDRVLAQQWEERLGALPYQSSYEALIMASIIEKESSASSERGHVAGVFVRRLEQGMRLQSDPTVIYGMGSDYDGDIRRSDLRQLTPYNTYRINGLPPTPIALPGLDSIQAALNPLESDYLYFVSNGDGTHYFSSNLEEHNAAVRRYLLVSEEKTN